MTLIPVFQVSMAITASGSPSLSMSPVRTCPGKRAAGNSPVLKPRRTLSNKGTVIDCPYDRAHDNAMSRDRVAFFMVPQRSVTTVNLKQPECLNGNKKQLNRKYSKGSTVISNLIDQVA